MKKRRHGSPRSGFSANKTRKTVGMFHVEHSNGFSYTAFFNLTR